MKVANAQWHFWGSAHWRAVARHAQGYGNWTSVFVCFSRWSKLGVWDAVLETLASLGPPADEGHAIEFVAEVYAFRIDLRRALGLPPLTESSDGLV